MRARTALGALACLVGLAVSGCTSVIYDSNPEGTAAHLEDAPDYASGTVQNLLAESIGWAASRYPAPAGWGDGSGWFAINLPRGVLREQYIEVATRIGDRVAPITPELGYLPTYHIGWVWMRGDKARVDVFRPVYSLSQGGEVVHQAITLHLSRRFASWRVDHTQPWTPGVVEMPPVYYLPPLEASETEGEIPESPAPGGAASTDVVDDA